MDIVPIDLPQKTFDLLLDFPLAINTGRHHDGAEKQQAQEAGDYHAVTMRIDFLTEFVVETAAGFVVGFIAARPPNRGVRIDLVLLKGEYSLGAWSASY